MKWVNAFLFAFLTMGAHQAFASATWPNEPAGSVEITDWGFNTLTGSGWADGGGGTSIATDATAPRSPSNVLQQCYPSGMEGGISPGTTRYGFTPVPTLYMGFWWKVNAGWQQHPANLTKIIFVSTQKSNPLFFYMGGPAGSSSYSIGMQYQNSTIDNSHLSSFPGVIGTVDLPGSQSFAPGSWVRIELYLKRSKTTTSKDGILRWWVNGALARDITTLNCEPYDFASVPIAPIWGGVGGVKTQTDYFWYDHVHISVPPMDTLIIGGATVQPAMAKAPYTCTFQALGGKPPYTWITVAGSLPPGLTLNSSTGVLSGTPTTTGRTDFTVQVSDGSVPAKTARKAINFFVNGTSAIAAREQANSGKLQIESLAGSVRLRFPQKTEYRLGVYDLSGRSVWNYSGTGDAIWNCAGNLKNGIYLIRAEQNGKTITANYLYAR